jgi:hypothetical protein
VWGVGEWSGSSIQCKVVTELVVAGVVTVAVVLAASDRSGWISTGSCLLDKPLIRVRLTSELFDPPSNLPTQQTTSLPTRDGTDIVKDNNHESWPPRPWTSLLWK